MSGETSFDIEGINEEGLKKLAYILGVKIEENKENPEHVREAGKKMAISAVNAHIPGNRKRTPDGFNHG